MIVKLTCNYTTCIECILPAVLWFSLTCLSFSVLHDTIVLSFDKALHVWYFKVFWGLLTSFSAHAPHVSLSCTNGRSMRDFFTLCDSPAFLVTTKVQVSCTQSVLLYRTDAETILYSYSCIASVGREEPGSYVMCKSGRPSHSTCKY